MTSKQIKINFSYVKHEFLVNFYEDNKQVKWEIVSDSKDVQKLISEFYFPDKEDFIN